MIGRFLWISPQTAQSRLRNGGLLLAFLLHSLAMAMKEDKTEGKQAENEGVFLWFGDDLVVDGDPNHVITRPKIGETVSPTIESSHIKISDGFVDQARAHPRRSLSAPIKQVGRLNANA